MGYLIIILPLYEFDEEHDTRNSKIMNYKNMYFKNYIIIIGNCY